MEHLAASTLWWRFNADSRFRGLELLDEVEAAKRTIVTFTALFFGD